MALIDQLKADMKAAMKARERDKLGTIRMLIAAMNNLIIEKGGEVSEKDEIALLSRQAKQRRESHKAFTDGDRPELAAIEAAELVVIEAYLPSQLSEAEVNSMIAELIASTGAASKADMGKVMGPLMGKLRGRFEGGAAKKLLMAALS